jgi:hypothetical protein
MNKICGASDTVYPPPPEVQCHSNDHTMVVEILLQMVVLGMSLYSKEHTNSSMASLGRMCVQWFRRSDTTSSYKLATSSYNVLEYTGVL